MNTSRKIKKNKCYCHPHNRDLSEYSFGVTNYKGVDIYECTKCKEHLERALDREERIRENNKKQEDASYLRRFVQSNKKNAKRQKSIRDDLWDFVVRDELAKGTKLKGYLKGKFKNQIPKEVLQLARATMKLNILIKSIKGNLPSKKGVADEERKKEKELAKEQRKPLLRCFTHGDLFWPSVIKSGIDKSCGVQRYKCKECMKRIHAENYKKNKEKISEAHKRYKEQDPEKYREMKNVSKRKCWALNKEKYIKKSMDWDKLNPEKKAARQKRYKNKAINNLSPIYVKQKLTINTQLQYKDIPKDMVDMKKDLMKLNQIIKVKKHVKNKEHEAIER